MKATPDVTDLNQYLSCDSVVDYDNCDARESQQDFVIRN